MKKISKINNTWVIGIDEVGRGPLAGPVTVCAIAIPKTLRLRTCDLKIPLKDSKKLSPIQRERWFNWVKQQKISYAISAISPATIDKINISQAANLAATRCVKKLLTKLSIQQYNDITIFLDGGLYLNKEKLNIKTYKPENSQTVIKGDEKIPAISLASIVAKVYRDKLMEKMHKKYPKYCFNKHKGYGTKSHFQSIKKHGYCKIHRKTFLKKII